MVTEILIGDCIEQMRGLESGSVDLTITSPPYDNLRTYNGNNKQWGEHVWKAVIADLFRVTKQGGVVVWVVGDATINGSETGTSFRQALWAMECGFNLHDTMIWQKISPYQHKNRYIQSFEYMFIFSKGFKQQTNLIKDRKNKWAGTQIHGTERQVNGVTKNLSAKQKAKKVKDFGARYNIWDIPPVKTNRGVSHPATFPEQLATDHIISWSNEGDTVLDCFLGSGTTGVACANTNRNFIGIELDPEYAEIARKRIEAVKYIPKAKVLPRYREQEEVRRKPQQQEMF